MPRRRRLSTAAALALALGAWGPCPARADEAPPVRPPAAPAAPTLPQTPEQAADAVLAAVATKDAATLKALATTDAPDPWLVADELIRRAQPDAAQALANAAPRVDVELLPAYVASRRGQADDAARRARLAEANAAFAARKHDEALTALGAAEPGALADIVGVRLAMGRGRALESLVRWVKRGRDRYDPGGHGTHTPDPQEGQGAPISPRGGGPAL